MVVLTKAERALIILRAITEHSGNMEKYLAECQRVVGILPLGQVQPPPPRGHA